MDKPVVVADRLSKNFGSVEAVREISIEFHRGLRYALLGPNGSGKTTLLHMLAGLSAPSSGKIEVRGLDPRADEAKNLMGIAPDDLPLPEVLTGAEYLTLVAHLRGVVAPAATRQIVEALRLSSYLDRPIAGYSHGTNRKLQFATAIMHEPVVLYLDEPYRGLDPVSTVVLREFLAQLAERGVTIIAATHSLGTNISDFDRIVVMHSGSVALAGDVPELLDRFGVDDIHELYLRSVGQADTLATVPDEVRNALAEFGGGK